MNPLATILTLMKWELKYAWKRNWKFVVGLLGVLLALQLVWPSGPTAFTSTLRAVLPATDIAVIDDDQTAVSAAYVQTLGHAVTQAPRYVRIPPGWTANLTQNQTATLVLKGHSPDDLEESSLTLYRASSSLGVISYRRLDGAMWMVFVLLTFIGSATASGIVSGRLEGLFPYLNNFIDVRWSLLVEKLLLLAAATFAVLLSDMPPATLLAAPLVILTSMALFARVNPRSWIAKNEIVLFGGLAFVAHQAVLEGQWALPIVNLFTAAPLWAVALSNGLLAALALWSLRSQRFVE